MSVISERIEQYDQEHGIETTPVRERSRSLETDRGEPEPERDVSRPAPDRSLDRRAAEERAREEQEIGDPKLETGGRAEHPDHDPELERAAELEQGDRGSREEWDRQQDLDRDLDRDRGMSR